MSSVLSSQGLVLATAMAVSSTVLFLAFSRHKSAIALLPTQFSGDYNNNNYSSHEQPTKHALRPCLCSGNNKKREKKKKKVQFAESVKEPRSNGEEFRKQQKKRSKNGETNMSCRDQLSETMPANRIALYHGILRDRVHRLECSSC